MDGISTLLVAKAELVLEEAAAEGMDLLTQALDGRFGKGAKASAAKLVTILARTEYPTRRRDMLIQFRNSVTQEVSVPTTGVFYAA